MISFLLVAVSLAVEPVAPPVEVLRPLSEARLQGIRAYRRQHLRLVSEITYRTTLHVPDHGDPLTKDPWTSQTALPQELRTLTIYRGAEPINVPSALELMGKSDQARLLSKRVLKNRRWGTTLYTLGAMGTVTALGGIVAMDRSLVRSSERIAATTAAAGLSAMGVGFVVGTFPMTKAKRLEFEPRSSIEVDVLEQDLDAHNDALRLELGLRPADVVLFERVHEPTIYRPR